MPSSAVVAPCNSSHLEPVILLHFLREILQDNVVRTEQRDVATARSKPLVLLYGLKFKKYISFAVKRLMVSQRNRFLTLKNMTKNSTIHCIPAFFNNVLFKFNIIQKIPDDLDKND